MQSTFTWMQLKSCPVYWNNVAGNSTTHSDYAAAHSPWPFITNQASLDRALSDIRFDTWPAQSPGTLQISGNTSNAWYRRSLTTWEDNDTDYESMAIAIVDILKKFDSWWDNVARDTTYNAGILYGILDIYNMFLYMDEVIYNDLIATTNDKMDAETCGHKYPKCIHKKNFNVATI